MRALLLLASGLLSAATASATVPRGTDDFTLGSPPEQVTRRIEQRGLEVFSTGVDVMSCSSDDPRVEYETYEFFPGPHGATMLWRVTIAYRMPYPAEWISDAEAELAETLGPPDSVGVLPQSMFDEDPPRMSVWGDARTQVKVGGRARGAIDPADRLFVTWTDRKLQRLIDARRRMERLSRR
jgi:hypothetical protein